VANATRFFYTCVIVLTYPIECFVAREVSINMCYIPSLYKKLILLLCKMFITVGIGDSIYQSSLQTD